MRIRYCGVALTAAFLLSGCDKLGYVEKSKYDGMLAERTKTESELKETLQAFEKSQDELKELKAHRYQTFRTGTRTWRLDTLEGSSCILLTTNNDWKAEGVKSQGCGCEDLFKDNPTPPQESITRACGE